jgi:hypothetical protein
MRIQVNVSYLIKKMLHAYRNKTHVGIGKQNLPYISLWFITSKPITSNINKEKNGEFSETKRDGVKHRGRCD